ncbi:MAG: 4-hydroxybenzoyl-CoA thioesterase [Curvibacter sp. GWA2_64_110]|nr:MAG: 4-hydroxybenzoyl-CoA thioesterase [Curvibacter sp. GWA2_64_110]HCY15498.1 4-hydroxybenzoyl-CoA thioesterase [Curvibacter sp.]
MHKTLPTRADFRFIHRLRVRWAEVDMQKIVFNAHYLMYFDTAISDYWRALALPYEASMQRLGGDLYVKKSTLEYHASARYDDLLDIGLTCARIGNSSIQFTGGVFLGEQLLVAGELLYVFADPATQTSKPVPSALRDVLSGFEAGETMVDIRLGAWSELAEGARQVRTEVFLQEQRVPVELEWDEADASAVHAVAYNRLGMPLATGRLLLHAPGVGRIGRMAVSRVLRGAGLGRDILQVLLKAAEQRGDRDVMLHAQRSAEGFYAGEGFVPRGAPFDEAGIPHIEMVKPLAGQMA